ncbi:MAG: glycosyltransferase [Parvularculaceae bacterium]
MRLVDISEFFSEFGGGVRTYVHQKLEACAAAGVELTVIAPGPADRREKRLGGEIIWVDSPTLAFDHRYHLFDKIRPVHDLLDEIKPHVVEGSSTWKGGWMAGTWRGDAARALFLHQDPVAVYPHSLFSPRLKEDHVDHLCFWFWWYLRRLSRRFDATVVAGEWFAERLRKFGVQRTVVAPLGIEKARFSHEMRNEATRRDMLAECGVDDPSATLFMVVSRHHPEKRLGVMMDAFARVAETRPAALYIIGDGPAWRWVRKQAAKHVGVKIAGHISDRVEIARRLASADYMLHGGAAETFGLVVAEALQSGLPFVAPHLGGAADLAHPAYSEVYRSGDPAACAEAMERIVARDRDELALAARAGANRVLSPADHFDQLLATYVDLARSRKRRRAAA